MLEVKKCVVCGQDFRPDERLIICSLCQKVYHYSCWQGSCLTPGCKGQPVLGWAEPETQCQEEKKVEEEPKKEDNFLIYCPVCNNIITNKVFKCPHCHSILRRWGYKEPMAACLFNLLLLGAGYFYLGQVKKGFLWLLIGFIAALATWGIGGFIVLGWVMYDSYQMAEKMNKGEL